MSKQYENDIALAIYRKTHDDVLTFRCGYSGNSAMPQPDVLITTPTNDHALELKKRKGPTAYIKGEDLEQLAACQNGHTIVYLVVKFSHYEPVVIRYWPHMVGHRLAEWDERSVVEKFKGAAPSALNPRVTDGGRLALTLDKNQWESTRKGRDDTDTILDELGVPHGGSKEIDEPKTKNPYIR